MRYRALRSLHYVDRDGVDRTVAEGDYVVNASDGKIEALLADEFVVAVRPARAASDKED